jgi:hypothetical protein
MIPHARLRVKPPANRDIREFCRERRKIVGERRGIPA